MYYIIYTYTYTYTYTYIIKKWVYKKKKPNDIYKQNTDCYIPTENLNRIFETQNDVFSKFGSVLFPPFRNVVICPNPTFIAKVIAV